MFPRRPLGALAAAALATAVLAGPAAAAEVRIADSGDQPNVTVDPQGTAHIAWRGAGADSVQLFYCRLPRGATACAPRTQLAPPGDSLSLPIAVVNGTRVQVISYRYGGAVPGFSATYLFTSTDGGASFDAGTVVGNNAPYEYVLGPAATVSSITSASSCGTCFQNFPLDGGGAAGPAVLSSDHPYNGALGMVDAGTPLAVFSDGSANSQFRRYGGSGDLNDAANWTPPTDIGVVDYPHLVSGPAGLFMIGETALSGSTLVSRRFDGNTFAAPVTIFEGARADHAAQDASGRIHVVAPRFSSGPGGGAIGYATSDDGNNWSVTQTELSGMPGALRLAVAPDHIGVVVWKYALGPSSGALYAAPIGPTGDTPRLGKTAGATVISGTVLIQAPGAKTFTRLNGFDVIPVGSIVDATKGRVRITTALPGGKLQSSDFFEGVFRLTQAKTGLTDLTLTGGSFSKCPRGGRSASTAKVKVVRHLWGKGSGLFRTKGKYASASLRGTTWNTIDRCDGTLIRVTQGRVVVRDFKKKKNVTVRAGRSYLAKA